MKNLLLSLVVLAVLTQICGKSYADNLAIYTGESSSPSTTGSGVSVSTISNGSLQALTFNSALAYATQPVILITPATSGATTLGDAVTGNRYFQFTITPAMGKKIGLLQLSFSGARGGTTAPRGYGVYSSVDGYTTVIKTEAFTTQRTTFATYTVSLSGAQYQELKTPITFRIYLYAPDALTVEMDDITLTGTVADSVNIINNALLNGFISI